MRGGEGGRTKGDEDAQTSIGTTTREKIMFKYALTLDLTHTRSAKSRADSRGEDWVRETV